MSFLSFSHHVVKPCSIIHESRASSIVVTSHLTEMQTPSSHTGCDNVSAHVLRSASVANVRFVCLLEWRKSADEAQISRVQLEVGDIYGSTVNALFLRHTSTEFSCANTPKARGLLSSPAASRLESAGKQRHRAVCNRTYDATSNSQKRRVRSAVAYQFNVNIHVIWMTFVFYAVCIVSAFTSRRNERCFVE